MRIGIDARLSHYQQAGIAFYTHRLVQALLELETGDEFVVFRHWRDRPMPGRPGCHQPPLFTPCHHHFEQVTLPIEIARHRLDCLHSPDFVPPLRRTCPAVITVHDLAFLREPKLLTVESRRYYGQIGRAVAGAEGIIAVSESTRGDLVELLGVRPERVDVIYEAPDPVFRRLGAGGVAPDLAHKLEALQPYLLFVGTLEPRKNLSVLLEALSGLDPARTPHRLVIAGGRGWLDGGLEAEIERLHLRDRVAFWGRATADELVALYNYARALVLPSRWEGFGLPAVEAMSCGTPVVASRAGALPEVVGEAGLLRDSDDADGWRQALAEVLADDSLAAELGRRGLARAAEFSWRRAAAETLLVYRKVARR